MVETAVQERNSPKQLLAASRLQLDAARTKYAKAYAKKNNASGVRFFEHSQTWAPALFKGIDPESILDRDFIALKKAYEDARADYLTRIAQISGANERETFEKSEKWKLFLDRFSKTEKIAAGIAGAAALSTTLVAGIGTYRILWGIGVSAVVGTGLQLVGDTKQTKNAKGILEDSWTEAKARGESYETFREKNLSKVKSVSRNILWDRVAKASLTAAVGFGTFTATGIRRVAFGSVSEAGNQIFGDNWGTFFVKGHDVVSKVAHMGTAAVIATLSALDSVWHELGIASALAQENMCYSDKIPWFDFFDPYDKAQHLPIFEFGINDVNLKKSIVMIDNHIKWMEQVLAKYKAVMDPHDMNYRSRVDAMERGLRALKKMAVDIRHIHSLTELTKGREYLDFRKDTVDAYQAAHDINRIARFGGVWFSGRPHCLTDLFMFAVKHDGFDKLPQEAARALYEFYVDMYRAGLVSDYGRLKGLTLTEGHNPEKGLKHPHSSDGHRTGRYFDVRPTGVEGPEDNGMARKLLRDPEYVYKVLCLQLRSAYYSVLIEPYDLDPKGTTRAYLIERLQKPRHTLWWWEETGEGMTKAQATAFVDKHYGNRTHTNGAHIHVQTTAPLMGPVPEEPPRPGGLSS